MRMLGRYQTVEMQEMIYNEIMKKKTKGEVLAALVSKTEIEALDVLRDYFEIWYKQELANAKREIAKREESGFRVLKDFYSDEGTENND